MSAHYPLGVMPSDISPPEICALCGQEISGNMFLLADEHLEDALVCVPCWQIRRDRLLDALAQSDGPIHADDQSKSLKTKM